jgi:hypothetical protein
VARWHQGMCEKSAEHRLGLSEIDVGEKRHDTDERNLDGEGLKEVVRDREKGLLKMLGE